MTVTYNDSLILNWLENLQSVPQLASELFIVGGQGENRTFNYFSINLIKLFSMTLHSTAAFSLNLVCLCRTHVESSLIILESIQIASYFLSIFCK